MCVLSEELELEWGMQLQTACSHPDLVKAETTRPDDKLQIVREVKRSVRHILGGT